MVAATSSPITVGATDQPSTLGEAFEKLTFPEELRDPLLNLIGADVSSDASFLAALPFESFRAAVATYLVLDNGGSPTLFQQGRVYKFFKDLANTFNAPAPSTSTLPSSSASPIVLQLLDTHNKLQLRDYLDQTASGSFTLLSESEISALRKNYIVRTGGAPSSEERPSDEQLSAMAHHIRNRSDGRVRPPLRRVCHLRAVRWSADQASYVFCHGSFS